MAAGDILSCEVLATGWQAKVVIDDFKDGGTYDFGDIDTDVANAKFVMTVVSEGYNTSGTLGTITRTVYGTRVCQKAYPNQATAEETESGGDVELTIALSDYVYDDDNTGAGKSGTAPTVTIASGWYTNSGSGGASELSNACTNLAVTNSSTQDYPKVIARWAVVPKQRFTSTFDLEAVAFHRFAANGKPVACVKFNDGATDTYVTAMSQSAAADSLPCYKHTLTASDYTDNTVVTCNFTAYPWVGDADSIITSVGGGAFPSLDLGPLPLYADPDDDVPVLKAVVSGSGTDGVQVPTTSYATAASQPFASIRKAVDALSTANGGNADFCEIYLDAGSYTIASGSGNGACSNGWVTVLPNPNTGATKAATKIVGSASSYVRGYLKLQGLTVEPTGEVFGGDSGRAFWADDVALSAASQSTAMAFDGYPVAYYTHCSSDKLTRAFSGSAGGGNTAALIRNTHATNAGAAFNDSSTFPPRCILTSSINHANARTGRFAQIGASNTIYAYNQDLASPEVSNSAIGGSGAFNDCAVICNVLENTTTTGTLFSLWSDGNLTANSNILVWHNTVAGERFNVGYNDSGTAAVARTNYSLKYNALYRLATKHDVFNPPSGNRIGAWSILYGVGWVGNHTESTDTSFPHEDGTGYAGIRWSHATSAGYVDDNSKTTAGTGNGDYTPDTGSPLRSKIASAADVVIPWDINGLAYAAGGCAGAITLAGGTTFGESIGLSAAIALSPTTQMTMQGAVTMTAGAAVADTAAGTLQAAATLSAIAAQAHSARLTAQAAASLTAAAGLTPTVIATLAAQLAVTADASLTPASTLIAQASALLAAQAALNASAGAALYSESIGLAAQSALVTASLQQMLASVGLDASAALAADRSLTAGAAVAFGLQAAIATAAAQMHATAVALEGGTGIAAAPRADYQASIALSVAAVLQAAGGLVGAPTYDVLRVTAETLRAASVANEELLS